MRTRALALLPLALLPAAAAAGDRPPPGPVRFATADGMEVEAQWTPGREGYPGIVALHGEGEDRNAWRAVAMARPEGWAFLAVDLRGFGGSRTQKGDDLGEKAKARDGALFAGAAEDALAALAWMRGEGGCHPARVGLLGAGLGASAAVEAAARDGKVAAVACLTLDRGIPGLDPGARAAAWGATPILLLATEEDMALGTKPFAEAAAGKPAVETRTPLGKGIHGTGMIGKGVGVEGDALGFLQVFLGRQVLDGVVDPLESVNGGSDDLPKAIFLSPKGSILRARLDSRFLNFSYRRPEGEECPPKITLVLTAPREEQGARVEGKATVWGTANADGAMTGVMVGGDFFSRKPEGAMPDAALVKGNVLEARIPWTVFGTVPVDGSSVSFRCEAEATPTTVLLQGAFGKKR